MEWRSGMKDNEIEKYFLSLYKKLLNVKYDLKITRKEFLALNSAHSLIKRQRAEIEDLKKAFNVDFDRFASEYDSKIQAEAIKEFAEKLKERSSIHYMLAVQENAYHILDGDLTNLVIEMTEKTKT